MKRRTAKNRFIQFGLNLVVIMAMTPSTGGASRPKPAPVPLEIQADTLEVQQSKRHALFTGNVRIKRGALILTCQRLEATYDRKGGLSTLLASGQLAISGPDFSATAGSAEYEQDRGILSLKEHPKLKRGTTEVRGTQIQIWLDEERVVIDKAQGTIDPALLLRPASTP